MRPPMELIAYDFDGSLQLQQPLLQAAGLPLHMHCMRRFEHAVRLWASPTMFQRMARALRPASPNPQFSLIGSGDFHHVSLALIARLHTPMTVVLFDNHPDWMRPPHRYHCGTWVYQLARLPHVARVVIVGLESGDLSPARFKQGDTESYAQGKVVLLPYRPLTRDGGTSAPRCSQLAQHLQAGIQELLAQIDTPQVYISIDKDCLRASDARTNWEQGSMPLDTVVAALRALRSHKQVLGADTVGDYSPVRLRSPLKWLASWLDRRVHPRERLPIASHLNARANAQLIRALMEPAAC